MKRASTELPALLSDERRLAIVDALVDHRAANPEEPGLSFTELRDKADISDSGNFNYHLDQLTGTLIHCDDGSYTLTHLGGKVAGILVSGVYADDSTANERAKTDRTCLRPSCTDPIEVQITSGGTEIRCTEGHFYFETGLLPGAVPERDATELFDLALLQWQEYVEFIAAGEACPNCFGRMPSSIEIREHEGTQYPVATYVCERCGRAIATPPGASVIRHPAVVALYYRAGKDIRTIPPWELDLMDPLSANISDTGDGRRVEVRAIAGDEQVLLELDSDLAVQEVSAPKPIPSGEESPAQAESD